MTFDDLMMDAIIERRNVSPESVCKYWIVWLDNWIGGILPSELVVIWADSWCGKSEIAYSIAITNAIRGKKILLFALEGDVSEIALRYIQKEIAKKNDIKTGNYRFNTVDYKEYEDKVFVETESSDRSRNLYVYKKNTIPDLAKIQEVINKYKHEVDMIIIDHLHYIHHWGREQETVAIGNTMRGLKEITDITKKPIILISHLKRRNQKDDPTQHDLHWSSNIWKEATTCILISKREKHNLWHIMNEENIVSDNRYSWTVFHIDKSRIGLGSLKIWAIYDRNAKCYLSKYCGLLEDESFVTHNDMIDLNS